MCVYAFKTSKLTDLILRVTTKRALPEENCLESFKTKWRMPIANPNCLLSEYITIVPGHSRGWSRSPGVRCLRWNLKVQPRREVRSFWSSHPLHPSLLCAALPPLVRLVFWPSPRQPVAGFKGTLERNPLFRFSVIHSPSSASLFPADHHIAVASSLRATFRSSR